jgi:hypothetical protein
MLNLGNIKIRWNNEIPEYTAFRRKHNENFYKENITYYLKNIREYLKFDIKKNVLIINFTEPELKLECLAGLIGSATWITPSSHLSEVLTS